MSLAWSGKERTSPVSLLLPIAITLPLSYACRAHERDLFQSTTLSHDTEALHPRAGRLELQSRPPGTDHVFTRPSPSSPSPKTLLLVPPLGTRVQQNQLRCASPSFQLVCSEHGTRYTYFSSPTINIISGPIGSILFRWAAWPLHDWHAVSFGYSFPCSRARYPCHGIHVPRLSRATHRNGRYTARHWNGLHFMRLSMHRTQLDHLQHQAPIMSCHVMSLPLYQESALATPTIQTEQMDLGHVQALGPRHSRWHRQHRTRPPECGRSGPIWQG